jgi:hypothetical protein
MDHMDQDAIIHYVLQTLAGITLLRPSEGPGAGDTFVYYDPQGNLDARHQMPFATIVTKDYHGFDESSKLDRPGVFRLNIGVSRETFRALFGHLPTEESADGASYDFAALDLVMPHPDYGRQSWVCILNPTAETFETVKPLLAEAYSLVASRYAKSHAQSD